MVFVFWCVLPFLVVLSFPPWFVESTPPPFLSASLRTRRSKIPTFDWKNPPKNEAEELCIQIHLDQRCPKSVIEGRCPAGFWCFPASTHLTEMKWISSKDCYVLHKPANDALIWFSCVEAGKHLKPAGQRPSRTGCGHPWFQCLQSDCDDLAKWQK